MALKLLIAEDEDMIRISMKKYIQLHTDLFSQIYIAKNGEEALDIIFTHRPEIMLLDINMPKKDGIQVMKEAKDSNIMPATIILSGYECFKYAQQAVNYGARCYMLKPSRSSEILKKIYELADEFIEKEPDKNVTNCTSIIQQAKEYVDENFTQELTLQKVADKVGISPNYLSGLFSKYMNKGFVEYLNEIRIDHACSYLMQNYLKTYEIAYKVGFKDEKYFSRVFKRVIGAFL